MNCRLRPAVFLFVLLVPVSAAFSQDNDDRRTELGERQRLVERKMAELEAKFEIIAHKLEAKEPERAQRLVDALQQAKRDLIAVKMAGISDLLDQNKFQQAEAELDLVIIKLDQLVRLLLNEEEESLTKQQEIDKLQQWREEITRIRNQQQQQNRETDKIANKEDTLKDLAGKIKAVEALIREQQSVIEETGKREDSGLQTLDRVANRQFEVREQTEKLAREIAGDSGTPGQPVSTQGEASRSPSEGERQAGENTDSQTPDSQTPDSSPSNNRASSANRPKAAGQQPLENAAGNQKQAEQKLTQGKATDAVRAEQRALQDLNDALRELKKEQRRIASLPPEAFQEMARQQRQTEKQTADLSRDMEQTPKSGDRNSGDRNSGDSQSGGPPRQGQPGQQSVQRARKAMQNAAGDLNDEEPQKATRQQEKALAELDEALREIEERLDQLREETREEKLARLEARFREMLARQQIATILTMDIDEKKTHLDRVRRREVLAMLRLGIEEREISELGQQAYDLLLEDGTSVVFPEMVQVTREDLGRVAQMLESEQTGPLTQLVQREIEASLQELLDALKRTRQQNQAGGEGGGGGGGNQPLLRKSAELKMLRAAQLRVNRLTRQFDLIRGADTLVESLQGELDNIRVRQADIVEMMIRIMEKESP